MHFSQTRISLVFVTFNADIFDLNNFFLLQLGNPKLESRFQ